MAYRIIYSPETKDHFRYLSKRQAATVLDTVPRQLSHQPTVPTRNRKILRAGARYPFELRIGELRVYYDVKGDSESEQLVLIDAVGIKIREKVFIGGEEVDI